MAGVAEKKINIIIADAQHHPQTARQWAGSTWRREEWPSSQHRDVSFFFFNNPRFPKRGRGREGEERKEKEKKEGEKKKNVVV